jgi:transglutaminase-like putative cysteine protease
LTPGVRYEITHVTVYDYEDSVSVSHHVARLAPRAGDRQRIIAHDWDIDPRPAVMSDHVDYFGNTVTFFAVQGPHSRLTVTSRGRVEVADAAAVPPSSPPWESARDLRAPELAGAFEFALDSPLVAAHRRYAAYAQPSFPADRPLLDAVADLTARINRDLRFEPGATSIATPLEQVFTSRRGVCQDFAHLQIACLRSLGLAARYVSGYLETAPPPDHPRLVGADASHAWVSVYVPGTGWVDVDPTNNLVPADVSPIRGVILGGQEHESRVAVDVVRI